MGVCPLPLAFGSVASNPPNVSDSATEWVYGFPTCGFPRTNFEAFFFSENRRHSSAVQLYIRPQKARKNLYRNHITNQPGENIQEPCQQVLGLTKFYENFRFLTQKNKKFGRIWGFLRLCPPQVGKKMPDTEAGLWKYGVVLQVVLKLLLNESALQKTGRWAYQRHGQWRKGGLLGYNVGVSALLD